MVKALEQENAELHRVNDILKAAASFFASMSGWIRPVGVLGSMPSTVAGPGCALVWKDAGSAGGLARFFAAPSGGFSAMCRPLVCAVARPGVA